jgi:hypothetical protein
MNEPKKDDSKKERRLSQEQYEMLLRCSKKKDMTEWNEWRKKNPDEEVWLESAVLAGRPDTNMDVCSEEYLKRTDVLGPDGFAAELPLGYFNKIDLTKAHMEDALIVGADLEGSILNEAHLEGAKIFSGSLAGVDMNKAYLQGARFHGVVVDGRTSLHRCRVDRKTQFEDVALQIIQTDPGTAQLLQYNIRRMNWEEWYKEHWFWRWPVRAFWAISDYGMSTGRVVGVFFLLALLFAAVYMNWGYWRPPGIVSNLEVQPEVGEAGWHYCLRGVVRPVYFSIVTMTTLGFGDMYANKGSIAGHVILAVQVILGYVLLGALITRFAVLFTAGGPAGTFVESGKGSDAFVNRGL